MMYDPDWVALEVIKELLLLQLVGLVIIMSRHEEKVLHHAVHIQLNLNCMALLQSIGLGTFTKFATHLTNITPNIGGGMLKAPWPRRKVSHGKMIL